MESSALAYFSKNPVLYTDMSECVLKGAAVVFHADEDGVLLADRESGIYMFAAEKPSAAKEILAGLSLSAVTEKSGFIVTHGEVSRAAVYARFPVKRETACHQVVYTEKQPLPLKGLLEFRFPEREQIEVIKREYALESPEHIEELANAGKIFCGFTKSGEFVGFIGKHPEGSMGLLQVLPEHRRKGYGEELERFMINRFLEEGRTPYGHVIVGNEKSLALQKKLGYRADEEMVCWLKIEE